MKKVSLILAAVAAGLLCPDASFAGRIQPSDLIYRGAFRLPKGGKYPANWAYAGDALAYYSGGNPRGPADGYPGSLFGTGHGHACMVSEIGIPVPVISASKALKDLNTAETLQPFADISMVTGKDGKAVRTRYRVCGLEYLPKQGRQKTGKVYFCKSTHFQYGGKESTHGWSETNLSRPGAAGLWRIGNFHSSAVNHYIFEIPKPWADANTPGKLLGTGRNRVGISGSNGPTLYAYGPWNDGNPPPTDTKLQAIELIYYPMSRKKHVKDFLAADGWKGGAWLTAGENAAVVLVGNKAFGRCWYGLVTVKGEPVVSWGPGGFKNAKGESIDKSQIKGGRGYHADSYKAYMLFYDPADLAAVAKGVKKPYEPQPYAGLDVNGLMFGRSERITLGGAAFDRGRGFLYVLEPRGDGDRPLVHVWHLRSGAPRSRPGKGSPTGRTRGKGAAAASGKVREPGR